MQYALTFLEHSDREFADGDNLQGSEKLWGAASQAVIAIAKKRGWNHGKYGAREHAVARLSEEDGASGLREEFFAARQFHANFYYDFMEDNDLREGRSMVYRFVRRIVDMVEE